MATADRPPESGVEPSSDPLEDLETDDVLKCRNSDGLEWFFAVEDGQPVRYHECFDYAREPVVEGQVAAILDHPAVSHVRVGRGHLDVARRAVR